MLASFYAGSFSYTSRADFFVMWGVSLTHPVLDFFDVRSFFPPMLLSFLFGEFLSEISGLSFDSHFLSPFLFFCLVLSLFLPRHFSANGPFSWPFSLRVRLCCIAVVKQLARSWQLVGSVCGLLPSGTANAVGHHEYGEVFSFFCFCLFLFYIVECTLIWCQKIEWWRIPACPSLMCCVKGLALWKYAWCRCMHILYCLFVLCLCRDWFCGLTRGKVYEWVLKCASADDGVWLSWGDSVGLTGRLNPVTDWLTSRMCCLE